MKRACLALLSTFALLPLTAIAQVTTGAPPFGTFSGGPDIVNVANLNSHITIPILHKGGRGTDFIYNLSFDSSVWYPVGSSGNQSWQPVWNWGWAGQTQISTGYVTYSRLIGDCGTGRGRVSYNIYTFKVYDDQFGTPHPINLTVNDSAQKCTSPVGQFSATATLNDGSGYKVTVEATPAATVYSVQGTKFNPPLLQGVGIGSFTDRNGNQINVNGSGVFTDTLGTTALTVSGAAPNPVTFTYTAPNNTAASYKVTYTTETVQTSFGCGGINEFGPTSENLVSEIDLPDQSIVPNDRYLISYEATPGHPGNVTGRIASITLPTGGMISYAYSGGSSGYITCADGTAATVTRTTPDGTWTYAHTESGTAWTTTVTDPQGNETVYNFQGIYQTERQVYQGSTTLLEDDVICYNGNSTNCNTTAITLPITERVVTDALGNQKCEHDYFYNAAGLLTLQSDDDYGTGAPGALLRQKLISYASLGNNIVSAPSQITIKKAGGTVVAQTTITYDGGSVTAPPAPSPQHVSVSGSRGNPTSISYLVGGTTTLSKSFTYYDTGNVQTATDVNGPQSAVTFNYPDATSTCGNAFPASVTEPLGLSKSMTWNCTGGVQASATDENGQTLSITWSDPYFWRPASTKDQELNSTNFTYANPNSIESSLLFNGGNSTADVLVTLDGLGRVNVNQQKESPSSGNYDSGERDFDSVGRTSRLTVPYVGAAGIQNGSAPATTISYDGLGRPTAAQDGGGGAVSLTYTANDVLQSIPAPTGENPKRKQSEYDSIGELASVCEITGLPDSGACAQNTAATGYWTTYTHDALGDLTGVSENVQSAHVQPRSFVYDGLSRMTSEANPETGAINYVYDSDATCGTSNGDLVKKTDAAGNVTCFAYDQLHRVTSITYPSGPNSGNTPGKYFVYDGATINGTWAMANAKTKVAEAYTATCQTCTKITDEGFSYTTRGEVSDVYESTPHSGGYFHINELYWANGAVNQISGLASLPTLTYGVDGEGRPSSVSASAGQNPVTSTAYNVASEATQVNFGSGDSDAFQFDPNTFRMTQYKYTVGTTPQSVVGTLTWNANGTLQKLDIIDPFNAANSQTCKYGDPSANPPIAGYDDLGRLASGNCGSVWSQTFSYDAFGNITKSGSMQFQPGYNYQTNQMATGASYDAMGDVVSDGLHSYAWNSDTRPTTIDTVTVTYDALGRMVEQAKSGSYTEIVYDALGNKLALMNGASTMVKAFAPLPAGATAVYNASGLQYYRHPDWLGSSRFSSTPGRTMYNDLAFAPFGETYAASGSTGVTDISFAGNNEDTTTNLYDAQFREYGIQGRWPSPDPAGTAAANPANPQSWNRYAYVLNNPAVFIDPLGLEGGYKSICTSFRYFEFEVCTGGGGNGTGFVNAGGGQSSGGGSGNPGNRPRARTTTCIVSNGRTTAPDPGTATGPGAFGLYPSRHPGMVAIDPLALGLFPGARTNAFLQSNLSQITFTFSPTPNLPAGFPTAFTVGDIAGGTPSPRVGGSAFNGLYDFDIYGLPTDAAARAATSPTGMPVAVTVTFPSSLQQINCGGPIADPVPANPNLAANQQNTNGALSAHDIRSQQHSHSPSPRPLSLGRESLPNQTPPRR